MLIISFDKHPEDAQIIQSGLGLAYRENQGHSLVELRLLNHIVLVSSTYPLLTSDGPVISYFFPVLWWMRCQAQDVFWSLHPGLGKAKVSIRQLQKWLCQSSKVSSKNKWFLIVSIELFCGYTNRKGTESFHAWRVWTVDLLVSRLWGEHKDSKKELLPSRYSHIYAYSISSI